MREIYTLNTESAKKVQGSRYRKRKLNKKRFIPVMILLLGLIFIGVVGVITFQQNPESNAIAAVFHSVEDWINPAAPPAAQTATLQDPARSPGSVNGQASLPAAAASASPSPSPSAAKPTPYAADNSALPVFLRSGEGDMKAFSISGIDPKNDKVVALTFDDGPNPSTTGEILDCLQQYGGHATFFVVGSRVKQFASTVQKIFQGGNEIGNHTYNHTNLKSISSDKVKQEISETNQAVFDVVGARPILVRPPEGSITPQIAQEIGRACILWTVDPEDWKYRNVDKDYNNVMDVVQDGDIVLMHDLYKESSDAAKEIIRDLTHKGYKLVTVSQMIQIAQERGREVSMIVSDLRTSKNIDEKGT